MQQHPGARRAPPFGGLLDARRGDARDLLGPLRRVVAYCFGGGFEPFGVRLDELVVEPVARDEHVEDRTEQRRIGAGPQPEEQVGRTGERGDARVGDDQLRAVVARPPDVARRDRRAFGDVRPRDEHDFGERDVAPGVRGPVDPERALVRDAGRHHAEPAVVVEVRGAEREPRELADEVRLLVVERDARQHRERVVPVPALDPPDLLDGAVERVVPRDRTEAARCRRVAFERFEQPVGVRVLQVALDALRAELPLVERELVPRFEADDFLVLDLEDDPALLPAEAAVRLHLAVDLDARVPASGRRFAQVRAVPRDELVLAERRVCHQPNPPTRADCASATSCRRQYGQWS